MADYLEDRDLRVFGATDSLLRRALEDYLGEDEIDEEDPDEDY